MRSLLLAHAILAAVVGLERLLRRDAAARSREASADDRGTTRLCSPGGGSTAGRPRAGGVWACYACC